MRWLTTEILRSERRQVTILAGFLASLLASLPFFPLCRAFSISNSVFGFERLQGLSRDSNLIPEEKLRYRGK
jgi:hypothetical protein